MLLHEAGDKAAGSWLGLRLAGTWHARLEDVGGVAEAGRCIRAGLRSTESLCYSAT